MTTSVEDVWRRRTDAQVIEAAGRLHEYTEEGRRLIRGELERRGLAVPVGSPIGGYSSPATRAQLVVLLLAASAVLDLIAGVSTMGQIDLISTVVSGGTITDAEAAANDARQQLVGTLQVIMVLVTAVAFLRWLRRSYANLPALGITPSLTPGWVMAAWFVPFMNLVRPYQIVKEMWMASGHALLGWWWAAWLTTGILGQVVFRMSASADEPLDLLTLSYLTLWADISGVVAAILAVFVVRIITRRQDTNHPTADVVPA